MLKAPFQAAFRSTHADLVSHRRRAHQRRLRRHARRQRRRRRVRLALRAAQGRGRARRACGSTVDAAHRTTSSAPRSTIRSATSPACASPTCAATSALGRRAVRLRGPAGRRRDRGADRQLSHGGRTMPSFDVVSQVDLQEVDNAVNQTRKEIEQRYDFKGSETEIVLEKTEIHIISERRLQGEGRRRRAAVEAGAAPGAAEGAASTARSSPPPAAAPSRRSPCSRASTPTRRARSSS